MGTATIWFCIRASGNNRVSPCATKAASHEASQKHTALSGQLSLHLQWRISPPTLPSVIQPPCCCFSNLPQLWLGSNWTVHFPPFFKATLAQPAHRVGGTSARLSSSCKIFSFAVLVLVLWKQMQLNFYNWPHGWITKPPLKGLVVKHCHCVNSSVSFRSVILTA